MDFKQLQYKALQIRQKYSELEKEKYGKEWTREQIVQGLIGDVGDLVKIVMSKEGVRDMEDVDKKLAHELSDCLWSILVIANKYGVDIEKSFLETMDELEVRISKK
jgi:NTP pyrophosphatase (non-canonical NTP hydrolase)